MSSPLLSKVWRIRGAAQPLIPGALLLKGGMLSFITDEGVKFSIPVHNLRRIKWPWLRWGLGFDAEINGETFKFSFAKPNASAPEIDILPGEPYPRVVFARQWMDDISSLRDIKKDKAAARMWKEQLNKLLGL
ncbi:MAG TPA: hypothetical protein PKC69_13665 [Chitinophagaceae bacterium]|nr:hypothetical protein [Chitinophagaceae bacterium]